MNDDWLIAVVAVCVLICLIAFFAFMLLLEWASKIDQALTKKEKADRAAWIAKAETKDGGQ